MNPALNSDGTYDWGTKWSAALVAWKGFKAGSIFSATSGTCYSDISVNATAASLTNSLLSVKRYKPNYYGWAGETYGQQQSYITSSAAQASIKLLNNYANTPNNWEEVPNGNFPGTYHISFRYSEYNGIRVECPYHYSCINISAEFITTDGGNGAVYGWKSNR